MLQGDCLSQDLHSAFIDDGSSLDVGKFYFYLVQDPTDLSDWRDSRNRRVFIHFAWYRKMALAVPNPRSFAREFPFEEIHFSDWHGIPFTFAMLKVYDLRTKHNASHACSLMTTS